MKLEINYKKKLVNKTKQNKNKHAEVEQYITKKDTWRLNNMLTKNCGG